ncbi:NYN domain-containing protein [Fomitopsis serialis]|uniref:NYN domain-containing protein n=1 Tax=Fomitopsis serialis TaxID=139415 RepID=UPI002008966E|nr:NYN domain-containing protein [Neoantrodia serialis]KAH9922614.1 NYN domain-containing protein [Neoantrodia serialis]
MTGANGSPRSSVVVFWDWENCPIPEPKYSMARLSALRQLAHKFGRNVTFRVYMDRAQLTAPRATAMRSRLYSAGIELVDCPHDGLKEVVDKAITVDMFEYALDNPAPSTLMLISGDRGYAPMLSRLSLRGYTVVIITPVTAQAGLRLAQCHAVYEWSDQLTLLEVSIFASLLRGGYTTD